MRSKNARKHTEAESAHMARVKSLSCAVCNAPAPTDAHHIWQGLHFLTIPLCKSCHQCNLNGIHGARAMWKVMRKTEEIALNETIARLLSVA
jgi:hypothetical protein